MEEFICCNILDFDGVLVPGEELMDEYILEFCPEASNKYCDDLFSQQIDLIKIKQTLEEEHDVIRLVELKKELDEIDRKIAKHFIRKDQVLEETEPEFENKIDYKAIYQRKNIYPGVLELVWDIHNRGIYQLQISNTHVNCETEIIAKRELLEKCFPEMKFVPVKFHIIPYRTNGLVNKDREPSDKVGRLIKAIPKIYLPTSVLVDNSKSIISRGKELGLRTYYVPENNDPMIITNPVINPIPSQIILQSANDTIDLVHGDKIKKLSL